LIPGADNLGMEWKATHENAVEIKVQEKKKSKTLYCYFFACGSSLLMIILIFCVLVGGQININL
jgi:hypothetical protein